MTEENTGLNFYNTFGTILGAPESLSSISNTATDPVSVSALTSGQQNGQTTVNSGFLQSGNFKTGISGWQITGDGNVEFNNGVFRGTLSAVGGSFGTITGGTFQTSTTGQRVVIDGTNNILSLYDLTNAETIRLGTTSFYAETISLNSTTSSGIYISTSVNGIGFSYNNSSTATADGVQIFETGASNTAIALNIKNAGTSGAYGMVITTSNASDGILLTQSGSGKGLEIDNSGSGNSIELQHSGNGKGINLVSSSTGADNALYISNASNIPTVFITKSGTNELISLYNHLTSATIISGISIDLNNAGAGLEYAFDFQGAEQVSGAVGGTQDKKIRVRIGATTYFLPCYTN
jgi:hypothetical protein